MSVLSRSALESSPLADLHEIASEVGLDGFRRLRKADLVDAILEKSGVAPADDDAPAVDDAPATENGSTDEDSPRSRRSRRGGRGRGSRSKSDAGEDTSPADDEPKAEPKSAPKEDRLVEGTVELLGNGSGFVRTTPGETGDDDVYISAAQVRRCELVDGDTVAGPVRAPRRSERHPSLVRVDTINGRPADEVAEGTRFEDLPAAFPSERFALGADDPTLKAIEWLTPLGHGSRATITGGSRAGKSEALRKLAAALKGHDDVELSIVLAGVRPEELPEWTALEAEPAAALALGTHPDVIAQAVDRVLQTARRLAARGGNAVVLIDSLDALTPAAARKALATARNLSESGSVTVVAVASEPLGGETTVIALDVALTSTGRFPALDLAASGTIRPELLVGDAGADAITQARAAALGVS
ncbi:MAG: Rho termination factor N-terminal domain-containing protein [Solirubrobacteraceae bacterium]|nr:Rho termination factor N-terminal domain-containing protein [Solirubrobacteraceae bacterium]